MTNHSTKHPISTNTHSTESGQKSGRNHCKRASSSHNSTVWPIFWPNDRPFSPVPSGYLPDSIHILRCTNAVQSKKNANGIGLLCGLCCASCHLTYSVRARTSMGANTKMPRKSPRAFRSGGLVGSCHICALRSERLQHSDTNAIVCKLATTLIHTKQ